MVDDGLSPQTRAWLASAGSRPNEPVREDRPEDVRAAGHPFPPDWHLRPGGHCAAKGGLTTLWAVDPAEEPDSLGRRPSDVNAGTVLTPQLAQELCAAYNSRRTAQSPPPRAPGAGQVGGSSHLRTG